jgi:hypothetical protein
MFVSRGSKLHIGIWKGHYSRGNATVGNGASASASSNKWKEYGLKAFKLVRTVFVGIGIYNLGVVSGKTAAIKNPEKCEEENITLLATQIGFTGFMNPQGEEYKRTNEIAHRVIIGAKQHIAMKMQSLIQTVDRIELRKLQLQSKELFSKSDSDSKNVTNNININNNNNNTKKSLLHSLKVSKSKDINKLVLENQAQLLNDDPYYRASSQNPHNKDAILITKLNVPKRFDLPHPLILHYHNPHNHREELAKFLSSVNIEYDNDITLNKLNDMHKEAIDELIFWKKANEDIQGQWKLLLTNSLIPNAFVSNEAPRKIFVNIGLLQELNVTDDELAMVLSHEISHHILNHNEEQMYTQFGIQIIRLAIGSLLGFELFAIADMAFSFFGDLELAQFSREHEYEADHLGIQIAARSCFNIKNGLNVMQKLGELEEKATGINLEEQNKNHKVSFMATHPNSYERRDVLKVLANDIMIDEKALNPACAKRTFALDKLLGYHRR